MDFSSDFRENNNLDGLNARHIKQNPKSVEN